MVDITFKNTTLRTATAMARVIVSKEETITAIKERTVPKGDVLEMAKAAGLLGVKKTPDLLPDCHPLPIEFTGIAYELLEKEVVIKMTVKTIYKTGVEVEAMHGASVVALTMYDMLKPIDKGVEIHEIKLLQKQGGKSSNKLDASGLSAKVIVCSDTISAGKNEDKAGLWLVDALENLGLTEVKYQIIPDEGSVIAEVLENSHEDLLIYTGGTGVGPRDVTPQSLEALIDTRLAGVEEAIRNYGQQRMPRAMLSRSLVGIAKGKLVMSLPGSTGGVKDAFAAAFPQVLHVFDVLKGKRHD